MEQFIFGLRLALMVALVELLSRVLLDWTALAQAGNPVRAGRWWRATWGGIAGGAAMATIGGLIEHPRWVTAAGLAALAIGLAAATAGLSINRGARRWAAAATLATPSIVAVVGTVWGH